MPTASQSAPTHREDHDHLLGVLAALFPGIDENLLRQMTDKMEWQQLQAGKTLFEQGDAGDSLYVVLSGRLQAVVNAGQPDASVAGEIRKGESAGEMSLVTGDARSATVQAVRDTWLARLSKADFETLITAHPHLLMGISRQVIQRLTSSIQQVRHSQTFTSIAIFPAGQHLDVRSFAQSLHHAIQPHSQALLLDQEFIRAKGLMTGEASESTLVNYLSEQEQQNDALIYVTDGQDSEWTHRCLRQADKVLVVADAATDSTPSAEERTLLYDPGLANCELVVVHPPETQRPSGTGQMRETRNLQHHYHVRAGNDRDMQRLGRILTGNANALVLAGGGAKGLAHIGIFRALREANIPIDLVGGTSIGSIVAGCIAMGWNPDEVKANTRTAFLKDKPLSDYTLPMISLLKGRKLQEVTHKHFGDTQIEDLWINFFCVSSNFSQNHHHIHNSGPLYKALTASASLPGILPPVVSGNHLLIDGSVFNNFPVDIMRQQFTCKVIGVDLMAEKEYKLNYDRLPGGWRYLLSKLLPFGKRYKAPSMANIMMKAILLASRQKQRQMRHDVDLYLNPPVGKFKLLDMKAYDQLVKTGYEYATEVLQDKNTKAKVWHD